MKIGEEIRRLRKAAGLTQAELAALVGITQGAITNIETGRQSGVSTNTLARIAEALGVTDDIHSPINKYQRGRDIELVRKDESSNERAAREAIIRAKLEELQKAKPNNHRYIVIAMGFGKLVTELRTQMGLSVEELHEASGVRLITIQGLEMNMPFFFFRSEIELICRFFNVPSPEVGRVEYAAYMHAVRADFGQAVAEARALKGWDIKELANRATTQEARLQAIEEGRTFTPADVAYRIASALGIDWRDPKSYVDPPDWSRDELLDLRLTTRRTHPDSDEFLDDGP